MKVLAHKRDREREKERERKREKESQLEFSQSLHSMQPRPPFNAAYVLFLCHGTSGLVVGVSDWYSEGLWFPTA